MSNAPLPTPLQHLGGRRFSFYPAIRNLEPNEWLYRRATWSECVVVNAQSGEEVWVPRIFLGEVSRVDEAVMVVGLNRALEWRSGTVIPIERRVIEFPRERGRNAVNDSGATPRTPQMAPVVNIRLEPKTDTRAWKWIGVAAVLSAVAFTIVADVARQSQSHQRADFFRGYRSYLQLGRDDDYASIVRKLGPPARAGSRKIGGHVFRSLAYPTRHYSVILMGPGTNDGRYIGALDPRGRVLDAVRLRDGSSSEALLTSSFPDPSKPNQSGLDSTGLRSVPSF